MKRAICVLMILIALLTACTTNENEKPGPGGTPTQDDDPDKVVVYFFWGEGCPHCATEKPFLEELENKYPELEVKMFETYNNPENVQKFQRVAQAYGTKARGVPATFIGEEYWEGYSESIGEEIEAKIKDCIENDCPNPGDKID
ncbi:MAG: TlpA family protein disulfide reductase [Candidatus Nanoarchaeia archaeon]